MLKEKCTYAEALGIIKGAKNEYVDKLSSLNKEELTSEIENSLKSQCPKSDPEHKVVHYRNNVYMFECHCCVEHCH